MPSTSVIFRNTNVAGNVGGTGCNFWLGSAGGNMDGGSSCGFQGLRNRWNMTPHLDAVAHSHGHADAHHGAHGYAHPYRHALTHRNRDMDPNCDAQQRAYLYTN